MNLLKTLKAKLLRKDTAYFNKGGYSSTVFLSKEPTKIKKIQRFIYDVIKRTIYKFKWIILYTAELANFKTWKTNFKHKCIDYSVTSILIYAALLCCMSKNLFLIAIGIMLVAEIVLSYVKETWSIFK